MNIPPTIILINLEKSVHDRLEMDKISIWSARIEEILKYIWHLTTNIIYE